MKSNKLMIASVMLIGISALAVSCKKEETSPKKAEAVTEYSNEKDGGGDEDPIIRVRVKKKNILVPVDSAFVQTTTYSSNAVVNSGYTNSLGEYDKKTAPGIYYFQVTAPGSATHITDTVHVTKDTQVTILLD